MAAITQLGTALKIGYGAFAYTGYVAQAVSHESAGEVKEIKGTDNQTLTKLIENLGERFTLKLLILDATGSLNPPDKGATVTLTPPLGTSTPYMCESASIDFQAEEAMLNLTIVKEVSMTYS